MDVCNVTFNYRVFPFTELKRQHERLQLHVSILQFFTLPCVVLSQMVRLIPEVSYLVSCNSMNPNMKMSTEWARSTERGLSSFVFRFLTEVCCFYLLTSFIILSFRDTISHRQSHKELKCQ